MKPWASLGLVLAITASVLAQAGPPAPPDTRPQTRTEEPRSLPAYLTPEERGLPLPPVERSGPPTGVVYCPPEYAPAEGMIIAWQGYTSILTSMAVYATTGTPAATVWVVVDNSSEQTIVYNTLNGAGADMSHVAFLTYVTNTVWVRDYGPRFIFEDGWRAIIDHTYNRPRPLDDAFPDFLAPLWHEAQYDLPLIHGGGNFHLFANGEAFMTSLILDENPGVPAQQVKDLYHAYQNVDLTIYTGFPSSFDSTRHIDMWMMPLGDHKIIIGQYAQSTGQPYTITEDAVTDLTARGYTVYRTPGWKAGSTHYTYTNAVILNNQVLISKFGGSYTAQDAQALTVYQTALPGYAIHQINNADIIQAAGAMHCVMMHVPAYRPDVNCDGVVDFGDIDPFVLALTSQTTYEAQYPNCRWLNADCNRDGTVDFGDIDPFVALLGG